MRSRVRWTAVTATEPRCRCTETLEITLHDRIAAIGAADWDACACPEAAGGGRPADPFTTYRFLPALEASRLGRPRHRLDAAADGGAAAAPR